jgi:putative transposase
VWLYHRFPLSFREVEELMLECGIVVSYETVRRWCGKFGQTYTGALRRRQPKPGDKWHLDEVFLKINGALKYLWRAVDQDGSRGWSSPTSSAPTERHTARSCPPSSTAPPRA